MGTQLLAGPKEAILVPVPTTFSLKTGKIEAMGKFSIK